MTVGPLLTKTSHHQPAVTKDACLVVVVVVVVGAVLMQTFPPPWWRLSVIRRTGIDWSNSTPHHTTPLHIITAHIHEY